MSTVLRAMGTEVRVEAPALEPGERARCTARVASIFEEAERRFSRFRDDSELSALNAARGPMRVSTELLDALRRAQIYLELTDGLFDPGIGGALLAHGYDRSFAPGSLDRDAPAGTAPRASLREVIVDADAGTVTRPPHVRIDLGGMIKGHTVDRAASELGVPGFVDAGGDAMLRGEPAPGEPWIVEVEDPADETRVLLSIAVRDRAIATSAPNRRAWRRGGERVHHLVDPRTRRSACSDLAQASVLAGTAELADVLAKCALLLGARGATGLLARIPGAAGVLARDDGRVVCVGDLEVIDA